MLSLCVLGSAILPPSHIPKRNLMFLYIFLPCVSLCFQMVSASHLDLSPLYCTSLYFTFFTSIHLSISHPSPVPPIFLSVCLDFSQTSFGLAFHLIFPVPPSLYLSLVLYTLSSPESTLLSLACLLLDLTLSLLCLL